MKKLYYRTKFSRLVKKYEKAGEFSGKDKSFFIRKLDSFLEAGCDVEQVVKMLSKEEIFANYELLSAYGANINIMWLARKLDGVFMSRHLGQFANYGVDVDTLVAYLLKRNKDFAEWCPWEHFHLLVPRLISVKKFLRRFSIEDILEKTEGCGYGFFNFVQGFPDTEALARKMVREIGYSSEERCIEAMFDLLDFGDTVSVIDKNKFAECIRENDTLPEDIKETYYKHLNDIYNRFSK